MTSANETGAELLLDIVRCPNVHAALRGEGACREVVCAQHEGRRAEVPEPWSGHLSAPILFVSSNPSIDVAEGDAAEVYPSSAESDEALARFFTHRFEGAEPAIEDGRRRRLKNGSYARATPFWSAVRMRARELLRRDPVPGRDYALTEVVHCKSLAEAGVASALPECRERFLGRVLAASVAVVVVVLGAVAEKAVKEQLGIAEDSSYEPPSHDRRYHLVFLAHPNARTSRHPKRVPADVVDAIAPALG